MKATQTCLIISAVLTLCSCQERILLSTVHAITLYSGKFTTSRRGLPIPQLRCLPELSPCGIPPSSAQCYNKGTDGRDVQWRCEAQLPKGVQFDNIQVSCEGYDSPSDPYILSGSCGLTYTLKPSNHRRHHHHRQRNAHFVIQRSHSTPLVPIVSGILVIVLLFVLGMMAYRLCPCQPEQPKMSEADGPPSYYTSRAQYKPLFVHGDQHPGAVGASSGPGFWTGAAVGGAAGYLIGSSGGGGGAAAVDTTMVETCDVTYSSEGSSSDEDELLTTATGYSTTWRR